MYIFPGSKTIEELSIKNKYVMCLKKKNMIL